MEFPQGVESCTSRFGIKSTNVLLENYYEPVEAIILIEKEKIFDVVVISETSSERLKEINSDWRIENYGNLCIFPGLIDSNVHLHTNFGEGWDNIASSTKLAAAGGVTTVVDNPIMTKNFEDGEEYIKILEERIEVLKANSKVDFGVFGLLEPRTQEVVDQVVKLGVMGLKCYLFRNFQSGVGHIDPEYLEGMVDFLSQEHPNLLVAFHPEVATERELYLSSPCRINPLKDRLDMDFEIKTLALGGGATKGNYLEEFNKSPSVNGAEEDDECPTPSLASPGQLKWKIRKAREKTEINQLVHFELMSYGFEGSKDEDSFSPDSDLDLLEKGNSSPNYKLMRNISQEKNNARAFSPEIVRSPGKKLTKKSMFKKDEIKEAISEEYESVQQSSLASVGKKSNFAFSNDQDNDALSTCSVKLFNFDLTEEKPLNQGNVFVDSEISSPTRRSRSSTFALEFQPKTSKMSEDDAVIDNSTNIKDNSNIAETKTSDQTYENDEGTLEGCKKITLISQTLFSAGLSTDYKTDYSEPDTLGSTRNSVLKAFSDLESDNSPNKQALFSPQHHEISEEDKNNSLTGSPSSSADQEASTGSNLLLRRITRKPSLSTSIGGRPKLSVPSTCLKPVNNVDSTKIANETNVSEHKFNISYRVFLANRAQNSEENGVSLILSKLKPDTQLRILIQNLSLASSFLKIREKKKSNEQYMNMLYGDTSIGHMFFNDKAVQNGETKYKVSPPFRDSDNRKLLIENFRLGGIDLVTSYHFFVPSQYKDVDGGNFRRAVNGFDSIGLNLQSLWTTMYAFYKKNNKRFNEEPFFQKKIINDTLYKIYRALCVQPAQLLKIDGHKGTIEKGKDADFVIWDPYKMIPNQNLNSTHIFSKRILFGLVQKTYLRGELIYDKDNIKGVTNNYKAKFITAQI